MRESRQKNHCHANLSSEVRRARPLTRAGFTLIELLITVAIILVLTTLYWSGSNDVEKQKKSCGRNLRNLHIALEIYANESRGRFPVVTGAQTSEEPLDLLVPRYTADTSVFICPSSRDSSLPGGESIRKRRISYAYYMGRVSGDPSTPLMSDRQLDTLSKEPGQPVFSQTGKPPGSNHKTHGGNFLFCDGHVESVPALAQFSLVVTQGIVLLNPQP